MSKRHIPILVIVAVSLAALGSMAFAAQMAPGTAMPSMPSASTIPSAPWRDRFALKAPYGVAFSEIRGYETWQPVAVSETDEGLKIIAGNAAMMNAYRAGIPGNGKPFPEGSKIVKIEWAKRKNPVSPCPVREPDTLKSVAFIQKDSRRFAETSGWGYAQFFYEAASDTVKPFGTDS